MVAVLGRGTVHAQSATVGPTVVVETTKGTFSFETYPREAPLTVAHVLALVRRGFYDGQRIHRAVPGFLVQWGDPRSRDSERAEVWGRGPEASSGKPIGTSEISRKHPAVAGVVAMAHPGLPAAADSQMFITLSRRTELDGYYTVFGHVVVGADVPAALQRGDVVTRMYVKE
jgi:peptidyl-prolyl cis-trans isomerase B (cyclophilin B)